MGKSFFELLDHFRSGSLLGSEKSSGAMIPQERDLDIDKRHDRNTLEG